MSKACVIEECKKCEADVIEVIATKKDIESEVAMDESMVDGWFVTFSTLVPETCYRIGTLTYARSFEIGFKVNVWRGTVT